jgi:hypothetical protein
MDTIFKTLYREANDFLIKNTEEGLMEKHLVCPEYPMAETLKDVYRCLLDALIFTRRMKDMIGPVVFATHMPAFLLRFRA